MDKAKRKAIIAGNWKMNKTASEAAVLVDELIPAVKDASCEVVICTPYTDLVTAVAKTKGTNIHVGAENVHFEKSGAFTGEISASMLKECGVEYVIIGHSERRQYFAETDETVNLRTKTALASGLKVILCVGEVLEQRQSGITEEILSMQTTLLEMESAQYAPAGFGFVVLHEAYGPDGLVELLLGVAFEEIAAVVAEHLRLDDNHVLDCGGNDFHYFCSRFNSSITLSRYCPYWFLIIGCANARIFSSEIQPMR